jgi:hypothetical protein
MGELRNPRLIYLKGLGFFVILALSVGLVVWETHNWRIALLLGLIVWSSARLYYFMFYVIEKYVDPGYKFAGIVDFLKYFARRGRRR